MLLKLQLCFNTGIAEPKGGCHYSASDPAADDRLSVLDANWIANYGEGGIVNGGHAKEVLETVMYKKEIAKEFCAPFSALINNEKPLPGEEFAVFDSIFNKAYDRMALS